MAQPGTAGGRRARCEGRWFRWAWPSSSAASPGQHERDDHRHQQGPRHDGPGRAGRDHGVPAGDGGADDPRRQAHRPLGPQAVLHPRPGHLRRRSHPQRGRAGSRCLHHRQLDTRGRRDGAVDPAGVHPHHDAVHRPQPRGPGVRGDKRPRRYRGRRGAAARGADHHRDQLAGGLCFPGGRRRGDRRAGTPALEDPLPPDPTRPFDTVGAVLSAAAS